jgi:MFS family permease
MDLVGLIFFGTGIALLSYVLEVFGEHTLSSREISSLFFIALVLLGGYAYHAQHFRHPLLDLNLFKIRTLRTAVSGNFITRLGVGGLPFLLPLLYQVGLGYSPIESGLLIMPQSIASMSLKAFIPKILTRLGYRNVLMVNTVFMGIAIMLFATIGVRTPVWLIVLQAAVFGAFSSLQYTSMNTLGYADINDDQASMASTIVSTTQQLSLSFGVAAASLIAAFFVPALDADTLPIIKGIHKAFLILGLLTIFSAFVFWTLRKNDGESISHHKGPMPADDLAVAVDKKR